MKYKKLVFVIILLFISLSLISSIEGKFQLDSPISGFVGNNIKPEDEGDHFPCGWELWCIHAKLVLNNGAHWDAASCFTYFVNRTRKGYTDGTGYCRVRHWNRQTGKFYDDFQRDTYPGIIKTEKNKVNVTYNKNYIRGLYPNYVYHCEDETNNIITNLVMKANCSAYWLYNESTGGVLPWGINGVGKAYFLPILDVTGNITINGTKYNVTGIAYHEHDIGYFDFSKPYKSVFIRDTLKSIKAIIKRHIWWKKQVRQNKPRDHTFSIHLSNDYLYGWDWGWIIFENNFNIVMFNPTFFGVYKGNVPAFIYFTKDGKDYTEIGCLKKVITKEIYIERAGVYVPLEFELHAYRGEKELHLSFVITTEITELYSEDFASYYSQHGGTFFECGNVTGYYKEGKKNISLNGFYQLDQTRWLPKFKKHRKFDLDLILPPKGLSLEVKKVNHRFGLERYLKLQLRPKLDIEFYIKKI